MLTCVHDFEQKAKIALRGIFVSSSGNLMQLGPATLQKFNNTASDTLTIMKYMLHCQKIVIND